ncbi:MAG: DUF4230 domain-containing protein [Prevotella sp.]|nr:DUF4230 domain-containing protein [Prevotella sp.]
MSHAHRPLWAYSLSAILLLTLACCGGKKAEPPSPPQEPAKTESREAKVEKLVSTVKKCSRLYTTEYQIHKIITHEDELKLKGSILGIDYDFDIPAGSRSIAIPIDATVKGYIDFGTFNESNVFFDGDHLEITLPDPKVELTSTRVNHEEVQRYVALLRSDFSDAELSRYEKEGRASILQSVPSLKLAERSRQSASRLLLPLLRQLDLGDNITITFRKDFDENSLSTPTN